MIKNNTWFNCSNSKKAGFGWPDGEYLIGHADMKQNSFMIWHNNAWATSPYRSVKKAFEQIQSEFNTITPIDR